MNRTMIVFALFLGTISLSLHAAESKTSLTPKQAKALVTSAKTAADHLQLAAYYTQMSENYLAQSKEHAQMKAAYEATPIYTSSKHKAGTIDHCEYFVKSFLDDAAKMKEMAATHQAMAQQLAKK